MKEWENLWSNRHFNLFYTLSFLFPAGPWDFFWRWKRYKIFLKKTDMKEPDVLELGSGPGINSMKIKKEFGGSLALVDNSDSALEKAKNISKRIFGNTEAENIEYINEDFFKLKTDKKFDLVHSQGVIEHFDNEKIITLHASFVKKGGYLLVLAPRQSFAYWVSRVLIERIYGKWPFGYEFPVVPYWVKESMKKNGMEIINEKEFMFSYGCLARKK